MAKRSKKADKKIEQNDPMIGAKVVGIRPMLPRELAEQFWRASPTAMAIVFDNGTVLYASSDEEGNAPGVFVQKKGDEFSILMAN